MMTKNAIGTEAVFGVTNVMDKLLHLGLSFCIGLVIAIFVFTYTFRVISYDFARQIQTRRESELKEEPDWRQEDHSRSYHFMVRSIYYHVWVKGKRVLHSIGGMILLGTALIAFFWIPVTGHRAPQHITTVLTIAVLIMSLGQLTPYFRQKKLKKLGPLQLAFHKSTALVIGNSFGLHSIYAKEIYQTASSIDKMCTMLYLGMPVVSIALYVAELYLQATWSSMKYSIAYSTIFPIIYGPLFYGLYAGNEALSAWYDFARVGDAVYMINISSVFFVSVDMLSLTMVLKRIITLETRLRQTSLMWMFVGTVITNPILLYCCGVKFSVGYFVLSGLYEPIHRLIPSHCFAKHKANQKSLRLLTEENAGLNVMPFVPGTKKRI